MKLLLLNHCPCLSPHRGLHGKSLISLWTRRESAEVVYGRTVHDVAQKGTGIVS